MPRLVLNRSVKIQPKSWRDFVKVMYGQTLTGLAVFLGFLREPFSKWYTLLSLSFYRKGLYGFTKQHASF
jgi:hypothetical protein